MTPEGKVKAKVKALLLEYKERYGMWEYWPVPSGFGRRTVDVLGLFLGYFFAIEVKRPGKKPTALQARELELIAQSGGTTFEISDEAGVKRLEDWLDAMVTNELDPDDDTRQPQA